MKAKNNQHLSDVRMFIYLTQCLQPIYVVCENHID